MEPAEVTLHVGGRGNDRHVIGEVAARCKDARVGALILR